MLKLSMKTPLYETLINKIYHCPITGCWWWCSSVSSTGYGMYKINGVTKKIHRLIYEEFIGEIPDGLVLDHYVCNNKLCVNPHHLKPVTSVENIQRAFALRGELGYNKHAGRGTCKICGEALLTKKTTGDKWCKKCRAENLCGIGQREYMRLYMREYYKKKPRVDYRKRKCEHQASMVE